MNYLAHALLAEPYAHSLLGNLAGDLVKGPLAAQRLHPRVADGVRRHRRVDALTDAHEQSLALRRLFEGSQRRYAAIVLDVVFDFFLTRHWGRFCSIDRRAFTRGVYGVLRDHRELQPAALAAVSERWVAADWLHAYESTDGVRAVLSRLSQRLQRPVDLAGMLRVVETREREFEQGFLQVFTDVQGAINQTTG